MYGAATDPFPYIAWAFMIGGIGLAGILGWIAKDRLQLRQSLRILRSANQGKQ